MSNSFRFGKRSIHRLSTCDPRLVRLLARVILSVDCTVLCGHRDQEAQDQAVAEGRSKTPWPASQHNSQPARAVDVVPYPVDWSDLDRMREFGSFVRGVAHGLGIRVRWGGDWDGDHDLDDQRFIDLPHFEIEGE